MKTLSIIALIGIVLCVGVIVFCICRMLRIKNCKTTKRSDIGKTDNPNIEKTDGPNILTALLLIVSMTCGNILMAQDGTQANPYPVKDVNALAS